MTLINAVSRAALTRGLVVGAFGGIGVALTITYSRRGPMIHPVFAALLAALALVLSRYADLPYAARFAAAWAGSSRRACRSTPPRWPPRRAAVAERWRVSRRRRSSVAG